MQGLPAFQASRDAILRCLDRSVDRLLALVGSA